MAVVGLHTIQKDRSIYASTLHYLCGFAIPVFFMSSGYILMNRGNVSYSYVFRKIRSVLRVVVSWSIMLFIFRTCVIAIQGRFDMQFLLEFPKLVLGGLIQKGAFPHFWYLGSLIIVYLFLPILCRMNANRKYVWVMLALVGTFIQFMTYYYKTPIKGIDIQTFRLWTWLQYFVLGGLLKNLLDGKKRDALLTVPMHGLILIAVTAGILTYENFVGRSILGNLYAENFYDDIFTVFWSVLLFSFVMRLNLKNGVLEVVKNLAPFTMGIYIMHIFVINLFCRIFTFDSTCSEIVLFVSVFCVSAALCFVLKKVPVLKTMVEF